MKVTKTNSTKDNLCDYCQYEQPTCPKANHINFGDGKGNDNIIECSKFGAQGEMNQYPIDYMQLSVPGVDFIVSE